MEFFKNLRNQSPAYKRNFAFVSSLSISLVILLVWALATVQSFTGNTLAGDETEATSTTISPFSVIKNQFGDLISDFKTQFANVSSFNQDQATSSNTINGSASTTTYYDGFASTTTNDSFKEDTIDSNSNSNASTSQDSL